MIRDVRVEAKIRSLLSSVKREPEGGRPEDPEPSSSPMTMKEPPVDPPNTPSDVSSHVVTRWQPAHLNSLLHDLHLQWTAHVHWERV